MLGDNNPSESDYGESSWNLQCCSGYYFDAHSLWCFSCFIALFRRLDQASFTQGQSLSRADHIFDTKSGRFLWLVLPATVKASGIAHLTTKFFIDVVKAIDFIFMLFIMDKP